MEEDKLRNTPQLISALQDENMHFYDLMRAYNISVATGKLSGAYEGMVYADPSGSYLIIINESLSYIEQQKTLLHEIVHIAYDMPKVSYFIGLNMQHTDFEDTADIMAENILKI